MAAKVEVKAKAAEVVKKTYKVRFRVQGGTATIFRDRMPYIEDKTDEAVKWLGANGYKESEIEIIGDKPAIWDTVYPQPVKEAPMAAPVTDSVSV